MAAETLAIQKRRMWIVTQVAPYSHGPAGVHRVLAQANTALSELALIEGFDPCCVSDVTTINPSEFEAGGILALFTIGETPFSTVQRTAIFSSWRSSNLGVLGIHSATDACHNWPDYATIMGARFIEHPWTQSFPIETVNREHPCVLNLPKIWNWQDELYVFSALSKNAHILLQTSPNNFDPQIAGTVGDREVFPLSWYIADPGITFYTSLGHFPEAWESTQYLQYIRGGIQWIRESLNSRNSISA